MKLLPPLFTPPTAALASGLDAAPASVQKARSRAGDDTPAAARDWRQAYGRAQAPAPQGPEDRAEEGAEEGFEGGAEEGAAPRPFMPMPLWLVPTPAAAAPQAPPAPVTARSPEPVSPTAARVAEAARQVAEPPRLAPATARVWQLELPAAAPGWQLHIEQAQPQAPLSLELRVPPVMALQARQQLADLDRRLRDAGHDLMRSRLRAGQRANELPSDRDGPVDEVAP